MKKALMLISLFPALAFAQAQEVLDAASQSPAVPPFTWVAVLGALVGLVRLVMAVLPKFSPQAAEWLKNHWWADWLATTFLSIGGAIGTAAAAGQPIDLQLISHALELGMAGSGLATVATRNAAAQKAGEAAMKDPGSTINS